MCLIQSNSCSTEPDSTRLMLVSIGNPEWESHRPRIVGPVSFLLSIITSQLPVCSTLPLQYRGSAWATSGSGWHSSWTLRTLLLSLPHLRSSSPSFRHQTLSSKKVSPLSLGQVEFSTGSNSVFSPSEALCLKAPLWIRRLSFMSRDSGADGLSRRVVCRQTGGGIGIQWAFPSAVGGRSLSGLLLE